jgi:CRP-like cAMP-binding protein
MTCKAEDLRQIPLFALLDDDEMAILAAQVEIKKFAPRQCIYKIGEPGKHAYVMISGVVRVTTVDQDHQEVLVDEPRHGDFFGFASMLEDTPHQTTALAMEETVCLEVSRDAIAVLLQQKPMAGMDMLTVVSCQFHASQQSVRVRASRNANDLIEEEMSFGDRVADAVARFGFVDVHHSVRRRALAIRLDEHRVERKGVGSVSVYPVESVSVDARDDPGSGDHDEPESPGHKGSRAWGVGLRRKSSRGVRDSNVVK